MTAPELVTRCPTEETLAAFIDDRLDAQARREMIDHIAECGDCRSIALTATEFAAEDAPTVTRGHFGGRSMFAAAAAIAAIVVLLLLNPGFIERLTEPAPVKALVRVSHDLEFRPVDARLPEGFPYKPVKPTMRGGNDEDTSVQVDAISAAAQEDVRTRRSARTLRALGLSYLFLRSWDDTVLSLEDAVRTETRQNDTLKAIRTSDDAELLADLSAAYAARARSRDVPHDAILALETAEAAWKLKKTPAAAWNRAVALEYLGRREDAARAWQTYLALDGASEWSGEARERLNRVSSPEN